MPTYEYACEKCGRFLVFQRITADPLAQCPTCGGNVQRLVSKNVSIVFKGSGFYITDTRAAESSAKSSSDDKAS
jgi:putative FmdB family regulatory protein